MQHVHGLMSVSFLHLQGSQNDPPTQKLCPTEETRGFFAVAHFPNYHDANSAAEFYKQLSKMPKATQEAVRAFARKILETVPGEDKKAAQQTIDELSATVRDLKTANERLQQQNADAIAVLVQNLEPGCLPDTDVAVSADASKKDEYQYWFCFEQWSRGKKMVKTFISIRPPITFAETNSPDLAGTLNAIRTNDMSRPPPTSSCKGNPGKFAFHSPYYDEYDRLAHDSEGKIIPKNVAHEAYQQNIRGRRNKGTTSKFYFVGALTISEVRERVKEEQALCGQPRYKKTPDGKGIVEFEEDLKTNAFGTVINGRFKHFFLLIAALAAARCIPKRESGEANAPHISTAWERICKIFAEIADGSHVPECLTNARWTKLPENTKEKFDDPADFEIHPIPQGKGPKEWHGTEEADAITLELAEYILQSAEIE